MRELAGGQFCGHYSETYLGGKGDKEVENSAENWQRKFLGLEAEKYEEK